MDRNYTLYFLADFISSFGSGMSYIGINWFIFEQTGINSNVSLFMIIFFLSGLIILPFSGTVIDLFNRKYILIGSNWIRGLTIIIFILISKSFQFNISYIYLLAISGGIGWAIYLPASRAILQEIISPKKIVKGNSFLEVSLQIGSFLAAGFCGYLYKYFGIYTILAINAATFLFGGTVLLSLFYSPTKKDRQESYFKQCIEGSNYLKNNPFLIILGLALFIPFVITIVSNLVLPSYVFHHLKASSVEFGIADMFYGIGACFSGFLVIVLSNKLKEDTASQFFYIISFFSLLFLMINTYSVGLFMSYMMFGLSNSSIRILLNSTAMRIIERDFYGRVMSVWVASSSILQILLLTLLGKLLDIIHPIYGYLFLSIGMLIGCICLLKTKQIISYKNINIATI